MKGSDPVLTTPSLSGRPKPCESHRKDQSPGRHPAVCWMSQSQRPPASLWRTTLVLCLKGEKIQRL